MFPAPAFLNASNIYEVNIRQYTPQGTFEAFAAHLPRLKAMGVEILWLMPIHPIGEVKRKGSLGSYYSIKNFLAVNPEFGNTQDLKDLISIAHSLGIKVILDWVANHASWDNVWTKSHPDFFVRDENGLFQAPYDWDDVIQLDHSNEEQQTAMQHAMAYWVREFDIDGFRADLAHLTPLAFWKSARQMLQQLKPELIWLAETENVSYHEAFDISFTWKWMHLAEKVVNDQLSAQLLVNRFLDDINEFPGKSFRLYFTSNHDENSWNGTEFEKYGDYAAAFAVLSCTLPLAIPLIYSGQEIPNLKRLKFFDKDALNWEKGAMLFEFYQSLLLFRRKSLLFISVPVISFLESAENVLAFILHQDNSQAIVILNFSGDIIKFGLKHPAVSGSYVELFSKHEYVANGTVSLDLVPGGYLVMERK